MSKGKMICLIVASGLVGGALAQVFMASVLANSMLATTYGQTDPNSQQESQGEVVDVIRTGRLEIVNEQNKVVARLVPSCHGTIPGVSLSFWTDTEELTCSLSSSYFGSRLDFFNSRKRVGSSLSHMLGSGGSLTFYSDAGTRTCELANSFTDWDQGTLWPAVDKHPDGGSSAVWSDEGTRTCDLSNDHYGAFLDLFSKEGERTFSAP